MKKISLCLCMIFYTFTCVAQVNKPDSSTKSPTASKSVSGSFTSIRNRDFSKLIGASVPGLSLNYNSDKTTLNGSFTIETDSANLSKVAWLQLVPSIGTTSSLFSWGSAFEPTFSMSFSYTKIVHNKYYYDNKFAENYEAIKGDEDLNQISTGFGGNYSESLRKNLQSDKPTLKKTDKLYTAKIVDWISIAPNGGGAKLSMYDSKAIYAGQITSPYYWSWGVTATFNHYYYLNNDDIHWYGFPTTRFFYYNFGFTLGNNNNTDQLKKVTLNDISSSVSDPTSNATRQLVKSTDAYSGQLITYTSVTPAFELLYSCVKLFAFDFFGNYNFITNSSAPIKDYGNVATGLYFYTSTTASKVNFGIYYQHTIYTNPSKELIGLKTKVPINW